LRGELGILTAAVERIFGERGGEQATVAVHDGDADAESAEVNASDNGHGKSL
jgi:hypothetical protein